MASSAGLAPEPIPLSVKVVLIGSPFLYYLLSALDEDFRELFKVKVDFDDSLPRTSDFELLYARFVGSACREEGLLAFSADGIARLIEHCSRLIADQGRLTSRLGDVLDLVRESAFWAGQRGHALVVADDVDHSIAQKTYRANLLEERIRRIITEGTLLIDTEGRAVGQVNGISVLALGDHVFGRPARITARTYAGEPGVVDIEREAKLGGPIHSKGVMILAGYVAGRYARERPLALSASIAFEQQYEEIEGDSASSAELYALLSSLTGIPARSGHRGHRVGEPARGDPADRRCQREDRGLLRRLSSPWAHRASGNADPAGQCPAPDAPPRTWWTRCAPVASRSTRSPPWMRGSRC